VTAGAFAHGDSDGRIVWRRGRSTRQGRRTRPRRARTTPDVTAGDRGDGHVKGTHMSQKRLLALVGAVAIIASACGGTTTTPAPASVAPGESTAPSTEPSAELADEQIIRWPLIQDPATIDPTMAQDSQSTAVLTSVQRGLVYIDKDLNLVPGLAESWDISPDAKTITFHLKDAQYSNGDPIVAADLVYSWKRLVDPRTILPDRPCRATIGPPFAGGPRAVRLAPGEADADQRPVSSARHRNYPTPREGRNPSQTT
jgi:hypothetical protein